MDQVLVVTATTKELNFVFSSAHTIFAHAAYVFALDSYRESACFQNAIHEARVRKYTSSPQSWPRYTPSESFEPFPFPAKTASPRERGEGLYLHRLRIRNENKMCLTRICNCCHDPADASPEVYQLCHLQRSLDQEAAHVYDWSDLDLNHDFHQAKQGIRFTISEAVRWAVLDRLLVLNHERYQAEVRQGLHDRGKGGSRKTVASILPLLDGVP